MRMKSDTIFPRLALPACILGLAFSALPSYAITPPALLIAVTGGGSVEIDSTGTQTYAGGCSATLCPGTATVASGSIIWSGTIGNFTIGPVTGHTKPLLTAPDIDLGIASITTGAAGGTITFSWTDTGFTVGESPATMNIAASGTGSTTYRSYVDTTNVAFGQGTLVATTSAGGIMTGIGPSKDPFSMTNVEIITLPAGVGTNFPPFNNDFSLVVAPNPPLTLSCGKATGTVGLLYSSNLVATGGIAPYTFSVASGSLTPLLLSGAGLITGTPLVSGTLSFTAKVVDSSGNTTANTVTAGCSILVGPSSSTTGGTPPALKIVCPTSTATVGVAYSSTATASGGTPPYKYSVAFGTLPAGLTLNASSGVISGIPTTASQTGAFKIEVTDSKGVVAYTNCSGTCSNGVTVSYGGGQSQSGYGDKGGNSASYSSNGIPINCYGFATTGAKNNLYSNNVQGNTMLGLSNWSNFNQIDSGHFVQFDISSHTGSGATGGSIAVTTLDWNASFDVYGSNSLGSIGTLLAGNLSADSNLKSIPNCTQYHYLSVKAHNGNCLVSCLQFSYPCACSIDVSAAQSNGWGGNSGWGSGYSSSGSGYSSGWGWNGFGQSGGGQNGWGEGSNPGQGGW